jgi:hypothetical protein
MKKVGSEKLEARRKNIEGVKSEKSKVKKSRKRSDFVPKWKKILRIGTTPDRLSRIA